MSSLPAFSQDDATEALRKEIQAMRQEYEARIQKLEARIDELEETPAPRSASPAPRKAAAAPAEPGAPAVADEARQWRQRADAQFEGDTETRDIARRPDAETALDARIEEVLEGYLDITGYFRAGYGRSDAGGPQRAFGSPGVAKYRLGNEAENYGELAFAKTFFPAGLLGGSKSGAANDPVARMNLRLAFYNPYDNYGSSADTDFSMPEMWGSVANVIPGMPEAKFWAGSLVPSLVMFATTLGSMPPRAICTAPVPPETWPSHRRAENYWTVNATSPSPAARMDFRGSRSWGSCGYG